MNFVYLNSRLVPAAAAYISVFDRGFAYGDSLIETMKIAGGRPVFFEEHFERLERGMKVMGMDTTLDARGLRNQIIRLAEVNSITGGRLRLQLSRGTPPRPAGFDPGPGLEPTLLLKAEPFTGYPKRYYQEGMSCVTIAADRGAWASLKTGSLAPTVLARQRALDAGTHEIIFTDSDDRLLEGSYTNIFFMVDGVLYTAAPDAHILPGVIRGKVIELAGTMGVDVEERTLKTGDLSEEFVSAFLTSSLLGFCPVRLINSTRLRFDPAFADEMRERLRQLEVGSVSGVS